MNDSRYIHDLHNISKNNKWLNERLDIVNGEIIDGGVLAKTEKLEETKERIQMAIEEVFPIPGEVPVYPSMNDIKDRMDEINQEVIGTSFLEKADHVETSLENIKAEIAAKGVDMTGVKPSGYDEAIASIVAASGDALAGDILAGKTAATAAGAITGTRPPAMVGWNGIEGHSGVAWPDPRFTDNGDGTVTDNLTGLMWVKTLANTDINHANATTQCAATNTGGFTDWRMPSVSEVISVMSWANLSLKLPAGHPFSGQTYIWTRNLGTTGQAFYVAIAAANSVVNQVSVSNAATLRYWPVRGPIAL